MSCLKEEETKTAFKLLEVTSCLKQQQENRAECYLPCRDHVAMTSGQRDYVSTLLEYVSTLVDDVSMFIWSSQPGAEARTHKPLFLTLVKKLLTTAVSAPKAHVPFTADISCP